MMGVIRRHRCGGGHRRFRSKLIPIDGKQARSEPHARVRAAAKACIARCVGFAVLTLIVTIGSAALAAAQVPQERASSMSEAEALRSAAYIGQQLYRYDRMSRAATEDVWKKVEFADAWIGSWVIVGKAGAETLIYHDGDRREPKAVYVATFEGDRLVSGRALSPSEDRTLSEKIKALIAVRRIAVVELAMAHVQRCSSEPFSIIPISSVGLAAVYFLVPQTTMSSVPLGGHYALFASSDGRRRSLKALGPACMDVPVEQPSASARALSVTHDLTPYPTEVHVWASLSAGVPIIVSTSQNGRVWRIEKGEIEPVEPTAKVEPQRAPRPASSPAPITVRDGPALAVRRGQLLHAYDQAAALATADFVAKAPDAADLTDGWVVDGTVDAMDVVFSNADRGNPRTVYSARIERGVLVRSRVYREGSTTGMTPARRQMLDARYTASAALRAHGRKYCSPGPPNTVVLPPEREDEPMLVYFLSPRPERDMVPMGGHYRVPVSTVDGHAGQVESFPGCDLIDARKRLLQGDVPTLTFDTDEHNSVPNEFHVYAAIALGDELHVRTTRNGSNWTVTRDRIRLDGAPEPRP